MGGVRGRSDGLPGPRVRRSSNRPRDLLVGLDLGAAGLAWLVAAWVGVGSAHHASSRIHLLTLPVLALQTVVVAHTRRLYAAAGCALRTVEMQQVGYVAVVVCAGVAVADPVLGLRMPAPEIAVGGLMTFVLANALRGAHRGLLAAGGAGSSARS